VEECFCVLCFTFLRGVYVYCLTEELREGSKAEVNPHHNDSRRVR